MGGLSDLLFHIRLGKDGFEHKPQVGDMDFDVRIRFYPFCGLILASSVIGFVGAVGVTTGLILLGKFSDSNELTNLLFIFGMSAVGGFGARRFLPQIRDRIEDELNEARKEAREANEEAQEAKEEIRLFAALRPGALRSEREECAEYLRKELENDPLNRTNTIILGRLLRVEGDIPSAISVLTRFINRRDVLEAKDVADALYNRACYNALLYNEPPNKEALLVAIKEDLTVSFELSPENRKDATRDEDFDGVRDLEALEGLFD